VLAAIYRHLGMLDYSGRPQFLLEQYTPIKELF